MLEVHVSGVAEKAECPACGSFCKRHSKGKRRVRDVQKILVVTYSKHFCYRCHRYFSHCPESIAEKYARYTPHFKKAAVEHVKEGKTLRTVAEPLRLPVTTLSGWISRTSRAGKGAS